MECFHRDIRLVERQGSIGSDLIFEAVLWGPQSTAWQATEGPRRAALQAARKNRELAAAHGSFIPASGHKGTRCIAVSNPPGIKCSALSNPSGVKSLC